MLGLCKSWPATLIGLRFHISAFNATSSASREAHWLSRAECFHVNVNADW